MIYPKKFDWAQFVPKKWSDFLSVGGQGAGSPSVIAGLTLWLEADEAYCFTDTAGTTPCTDNTVIKCWRTAGGLALDFVQAAAETTTRRFRSSGGKKWVEFGGGTNDYLATAAAAGTTGPVGVTLAVAMRANAASGSGTVAALGNVPNTGILAMIRGDGGTQWSSLVSGASVNTTADDTGGSGVGVDRRYMIRCDPVTLQTLRFYRNNTQVASAGRTAALYTVTGRWTIGEDIANPNRLFSGRVYAAAAYTRDIGDTESALLDSYLVSRVP